MPLALAQLFWTTSCAPIAERRSQVIDPTQVIIHPVLSPHQFAPIS
jgi:hypothetical protein